MFHCALSRSTDGQRSAYSSFTFIFADEFGYAFLNEIHSASQLSNRINLGFVSHCFGPRCRAMLSFFPGAVWQHASR